MRVFLLISTPCWGKWGKVLTWSKVIFGPTGFNIQNTDDVI